MRNLFLYIAIGLTIAIIIGSLIPIKGHLVPGVSLSDKTIHGVAYFILTTCWLLTIKNKRGLIIASGVISVGILAYGILIEVLQGTVTLYREFDFLDILANFIGIIIAFAFFITVLKKISFN